jgi:hypothetical protein
LVKGTRANGGTSVVRGSRATVATIEHVFVVDNTAGAIVVVAIVAVEGHGWSESSHVANK